MDFGSIGKSVLGGGDLGDAALGPIKEQIGSLITGKFGGEASDVVSKITGMKDLGILQQLLSAIPGLSSLAELRKMVGL
jgi:signal recognition particle GTPase